MSARLDGSKRYALFDQMTWPLPDSNLSYRLRYGKKVDDADRMRLSSILDAYHELLVCPRTKREHVIRTIRALLASPETAGGTINGR